MKSVMSLVIDHIEKLTLEEEFTTSSVAKAIQKPEVNVSSAFGKVHKMALMKKIRKEGCRIIYKKKTQEEKDKPKVNYYKMSTSEMAEEMCLKLDAEKANDGIYSLQVYEVTDGDIQASKIESVIQGHVLHYSPTSHSFVSGYKTRFNLLTKEKREELWRETNREKALAVGERNQRMREAQLRGY